MFRLIYSVLFLSLTLQAFSQIQFSDAEILIQSRRVWRGERLGKAPAIEPSVTLSGGRFSFNFWTSITTNNSYSEIDLISAWQFNNFQLTLLDYFNPVPGENNQYLNFQEGKNRHSLELCLDNYSIEKQRFKWMVGTFLLGDRNEDTGKPLYSTYLEFKYPFSIWSIETEPFLGVTPFHGLYAPKFAFVNTGISFSKSFSITPGLSVPVSVRAISNPDQNKYFLVFCSGIAFSNLK